MSIESRAEVRHGPDGSAVITVRFWAGARAAAGSETTTLVAATIGDLCAALVTWRPALAPVLEVSTLLVDGRAMTDPTTPLDASMSIEVLPPFAGG